MKTQNSKLKTQNGFTLLEVVVAMSIVALGVVTLFEIFSSGLRLGARSFERTEATAYGREALDGFLIRGGASGSGESGYLGEKYRWSIQVKTLPENGQFSSTAWDLKEITLQMQYREGAREKELELRTLRLGKKKNP